MAVAQKLATDFKASGVTHSPKVAKLSVSGVGLRTHTGVAIRMFRALSEAGINVEMINTSAAALNDQRIEHNTPLRRIANETYGSRYFLGVRARL